MRALQEGLIAYESDKYGLGSPSKSFDGPTQSAVEAYMQELSPDLKLKPEDFLLGGDAAFQGCSEFNPLIVFSKGQRKEFKKPARKAERDAENRPNRRVMGFLWRRDAKVPKEKWPCKKAADGLQPCKDRFWDKKDDRRHPRDVGRQWDPSAKPGTPAPPTPNVWTYEPAADTFACRFYHRLAMFSPCEFTRPPTQKWRIEVRAVEAFDHKVAEAHRDVNKVLARMYPPKHANRRNLHLDWGIFAKYEFDLDLVLEKTKAGDWKPKSGKVQRAAVRGESVAHPAFAAYYAKPGVHPDSTVDFKADQHYPELLGKADIKDLKGRAVGVEMVTDPVDITRLYTADAQPLVIFNWSPDMARTHPAGGVGFDYHGFHYDVRPGRDLGKYKKAPHVKLKWPRFEHCKAVIRTKGRMEAFYVWEMWDPQLTFFLSDQTLPLVDGAKFVFHHCAGERRLGPFYRDEPFYYLIYEFTVRGGS